MYIPAAFKSPRIPTGRSTLMLARLEKAFDGCWRFVANASCELRTPTIRWTHVSSDKHMALIGGCPLTRFGGSSTPGVPPAYPVALQ